MDINIVSEIAHKLMVNRKAHLAREKGFIYYHGVRVSKLALKLREVIIPEDYSHDDILVVASLLHDVAKGIEPHGKFGAVLVKDILREHCTEYEINEIADIVHYHQQRIRENNYSDYIKIVQDADILDHFGAIEIWMNFQHYAYTDEPMHNSVEFYSSEFDSIVHKSRELLNYDVSRKIFDDKISFVNSFVDRFKKESEGELCIKI
jgi:uncharacterized protein